MFIESIIELASKCEIVHVSVKRRTGETTLIVTPQVAGKQPKSLVVTVADGTSDPNTDCALEVMTYATAITAQLPVSIGTKSNAAEIVAEAEASKATAPTPAGKPKRQRSVAAAPATPGTRVTDKELAGPDDDNGGDALAPSDDIPNAE
jgi:hypothetical protein